MASFYEAVGVGAAIAAVSLSFAIHKLAEKVERLERAINAVFRYAQETDPRHDDERWLLKELHDGQPLSGLHHMDLMKAKRARGERTLEDPIYPLSDR